jgi:hypothetical protein
MPRLEYLISILLALIVLGAAVAWTHATHDQTSTAGLKCRSGVPTSGFAMKGMSVYPRCGGKRG